MLSSYSAFQNVPKLTDMLYCNVAYQVPVKHYYGYLYYHLKSLTFDSLDFSLCRIQSFKHLNT